MLKTFSTREWAIIGVLVWMIAVESMSIDLYLPAFIQLSEDLQTDIGKVQVSLSVFLGGFAIGQLFWGTVADRYGRKRPAMMGFVVYILASFLLAGTDNITELWSYRFLQAFGGAAGVVIARAVVIDIFSESQVARVFSLLLFIMGAAPVVAPAIGTFILEYWDWRAIFHTMALFGVAGVLSILFLLPETLREKGDATGVKDKGNLLGSYANILSNRHFMLFTLIGSLAYGGLMVYVANSPFLIMEKGEYSERTFSLIFAANAGTLMLATFMVNVLLRYVSETMMIKVSLVVKVLSGLVVLGLVSSGGSMSNVIIASGIYVFALGFLLPTTTALALTPFDSDETGKASALLGFLQLVVTAGVSAMTGIWHDGSSLFPFAGILLGCGAVSLVAYGGMGKKNESIKLIYKSK